MKQRLGLIKLYMEFFEPENSYLQLKYNLHDIKDDITVLSKIKKSLSIFHKEIFHDKIIKMTELKNIMMTNLLIQ